MAEIVGQDKQKGGKKKPKKHSTNIDMTPMVDLMCLLITFFMLTVAFAKPKVMDIILPEKVQKNEKVEPPKIADSRTLNIILGPDNKLYWYPGAVKPEDFNNLPPLNETDYSAEGVRKLLLERNRTLAKKIDDFNKDVISGKIQISQDSVQGAIRMLKRVDDTGPIVLVKAYKNANYGNFVDILDEMNICGIARYTFMKIAWYEIKMVETAAGIQSTAATTASSN